jgi:ribosomal 50S subunit-recycling heat shock protein
MTGADTGSDGQAQRDAAATQRLDKWLWFARIVKSRTLAAEVIGQGKVRVNRARVLKASQIVRIGDVLTIALRGRVQVLKVAAPGVRRGPPPLARQLYENLTPTAPRPAGSTAGQRPSGAGRPTKKDRRVTDRLKEDQQ